jgi:hypothetical protein
MLWETITKQTARETNSPWYFTGEPCKNGHIDRRYVRTEICYECKRGRAKRDYTNHKQRVLKSAHKSYSLHKTERKKKSNEWANNNRESSRRIKRRNAAKHHDKYLSAEKKRIKLRRQQDPQWRLNRNMSKAVWNWLKKSKDFQHWETLVNFTVAELRQHLEEQFDENMTWDNYGRYWHVDHIYPISRCKTFEEAWALTNLQPLERIENLRKGNRS